MTCALCNGPGGEANPVAMSRKFRMAVCEMCNRRIRLFKRWPQCKADRKARQAVTSLVCMVLARRGLTDAYDAAVLLWDVLEPRK